MAAARLGEYARLGLWDGHTRAMAGSSTDETMLRIARTAPQLTDTAVAARAGCDASEVRDRLAERTIGRVGCGPTLSAAAGGWQARRYGARLRMPPAALSVLAADNDPSVRAAVAANPATPPRLLARLAVDVDSHVRRCAVSSSRCPTTSARRAAAPGLERAQRIAAAGSPPDAVARQMFTARMFAV